MNMRLRRGALAGIVVCAALLLGRAPCGIAPKAAGGPLHEAVGLGSMDAVKHALAADGIEVDAPDANGEPALMHAAWDGKLEILRLLIDAGANPNPQDRNGDCPLLFASWQGHLPVIEALCSAPNINPNLQNKKGFTALMIALVSEQLGHDRENSFERAPRRVLAVPLLSVPYALLLALPFCRRATRTARPNRVSPGG